MASLAKNALLGALCLSFVHATSCVGSQLAGPHARPNQAPLRESAFTDVRLILPSPEIRTAPLQPVSLDSRPSPSLPTDALKARPYNAENLILPPPAREGATLPSDLFLVHDGHGDGAQRPAPPPVPAAPPVAVPPPIPAAPAERPPMKAEEFVTALEGWTKRGTDGASGNFPPGAANVQSLSGGVYSLSVQSGKNMLLPNGVAIRQGPGGEGVTAKQIGQWHSLSGVGTLATQGNDPAIRGREFNVQLRNGPNGLEFRYVDQKLQARTEAMVGNLEDRVRRAEGPDKVALTAVLEEVKTRQTETGSADAALLDKATGASVDFDEKQPPGSTQPNPAAPAGTEKKNDGPVAERAATGRLLV